MSTNDDPRLRTYKALRQAVGYLGIGFPLILSLGAFAISDIALLETISHYFDTVMQGVFVGVLFVIGVFLFFYLGYEKAEDEGRFWPSDNFAGNLACIFALGVALFPTTSDTGWVRTVHSIAAIGMFTTLAYFSLFLFTKTKKGVAPTPRKMIRNRWYRGFGVTIVFCIILIPIFNSFPEGSTIADLQPAFWLESLALWAFGFAWAMKGEARWLLPDTK